MNTAAISEPAMRANIDMILQATMVLGLISLASVLASLAVIFRKNGYRWWYALIPGYNFYLICRLAKLSPWWMVFLAFPYLVQIIASTVGSFGEFAQAFHLHGLATLATLSVQFLIINGLRRELGASKLYTIGCWALPLIFFPLLARKTMVE
jgi:hypothetical protein